MNKDLIERNETNKDSRGGTELLQDRLYSGSVPRELLEKFQITFSRVRDLDENRFRIFYAHDTPEDPESHFLKWEGGHDKFHKFVFVSNWQMQAYINKYNIPWSKCEVIENSIVPITKNREGVPIDLRICYTSTPHRGLHLLYAAFDALSKKHENVILDVFSSFKLYGWEQRDEQYRQLFDLIDAHPKINNHGTKSNDEIRRYLAEDGHIFAYPSIWPETSCLCLIEAMSAGLMCVHSNYGALPDTAAGFTYMYQYDEDENRHATKLYSILDAAIMNLSAEEVSTKIKFAKMYADTRFNSALADQKWTHLLSKIVAENPDKSLPKPMYRYVS